jgi:hypothetical protein
MHIIHITGVVQVWEVTAQLIGLAGSVALLRAIEATGKPENVVYIWAINQVRSDELFKAAVVGFCLFFWGPMMFAHAGYAFMRWQC